tara:strand:+ start:69 stop:278 length:210 start_codon:yes stop_codon:yes gene_type:complete
MIGWLGLGLLMLAYLVLVTKWSRFFIPMDAVASFILTIHAVMIHDVVFTMVNGWITIILSIKWYKNELF